MANFVEQQHPDIRDDESLAVIGALLELAGHKNPRMRVLELDGDAQGYKAKMWLSMLGRNTAFSLCQSYNVGTLSDEGEVSIKDDVEGPFDVVVIPRVSDIMTWSKLGHGRPVANPVCHNSTPLWRPTMLVRKLMSLSPRWWVSEVSL